MPPFLFLLICYFRERIFGSVPKGMVVTLIADGQDENAAIKCLVELVQEGLAE